MKQYCLLFIFFMAFSMGASAQRQGNGRAPHSHMNEEEFRRKVQEHITEKAELTEQEARDFFPVFHQYKNEQRNIYRRIHMLKQHPPKSDIDADYQEQIMQIAKLNAEASRLDMEYYKKLSKIISAKKFYNILHLEDQMHRNILRNYNGQRGKRQRAANRQ